MNNMEPWQHCELSIDLAAIRENYLRLAEVAGSAEVAPVLKGNAGNLGASVIGPVLSQLGAQKFFVAYLEEGIQLRKALTGTRAGTQIYVLCGGYGPLMPQYGEFDLTPVINSQEQLMAWQSQSRNGKQILPLALQIDLGLGRLGFGVADFESLVSNPDWCADLVPDLVFAHLPSGNDRESADNHTDLQRFRELRARVPDFRASLAASAGIFLGSEYHFDIVRPGCALFGVNPVRGSKNPMQPVVRLESRVLQVQNFPAGSLFGYGRSFQTEREMQVGIVSFGGMDGALFSPSPGKPITIRIAGSTVNVIGSGGSDTMFVDLTDLNRSECFPGQVVTFVDAEKDLQACAAEHGFTEYEFMARLGERLPRRFLR